MWLLNFLPFWVFHLITLIGAVGWLISVVMKMIPFVLQYRIPIQVVSSALLVFGIYSEGGLSNQEMWEARVKEMEHRAEIAELKANEATNRVEYKFIDKVKVVHDVQVVVKEKLKEVATIIDSQCKLTPEAIELMNAAAKNIKPGTIKK